MLKLLKMVLIQPLINIIQSWINILNGNIVSVSNIDNNIEIYGYDIDYENIKHDFQMIGYDIEHAMKDFDNEQKDQGQ